MRTRMRLFAGLAAVAVTGSFILITSATAQADSGVLSPYDCTRLGSQQPWEFASICWQGTGSHRAKARCFGRSFTGVPANWTSYSPWKPVGQESWGSCDHWYMMGEYAEDWSIETRD